jgi:hypothetical protein
VLALLLEELGQPTLVLLVEAGLDELVLEPALVPSTSATASQTQIAMAELPPLAQLQEPPVPQPPQESVAAVLETPEELEALMQPMVVA